MSDKKMLILENHPDNGRYLTEYFRSQGFVVRLVSTVAAALDSCQDFQPQVVIAENRVKNINGLTLLEELVNRPQFTTISVICISTELEQRLVDRAKAMGAYAFVAKPCHNLTLARLVEECVARVPVATVAPMKAMAATAAVGR